MKIAQVAPLYESVPPQAYGGTERVVSYLTEELVDQGHDVTLFASGDSVTSATLIPCSERSLRLDKNSIDHLAHHVVMMEQVFKRAAEFDFIHFHTDYLHFPLSRRTNPAQLTTLHGRLDIPDLAPLYREFPEMPLISISNSQRTPLPDANWRATVYHGLPTDLYTHHEKPKDYLAFVGRISAEKGADRAIEIAKSVGMRLKIAAKLDAADKEYYESRVKGLLDTNLVEFVGEIKEDQKDEFLGNAYALLFPIDWPEPFGLVMIEAMACGTPVVAFRGGSVDEVMLDGLTGFVVDDLGQAVAAVERIPKVSRLMCRKAFEERFTVPRMAHDYLREYKRLLDERDSDWRREGVSIGRTDSIQ
jgi:glycosyltransferase involved in cell wall biosynthesis